MTGLAFDVLLDTGEYISIKLLRSGELEEKSPFERGFQKKFERSVFYLNITEYGYIITHDIQC